jgi:hypothetical protein
MRHLAYHSKHYKVKEGGNVGWEATNRILAPEELKAKSEFTEILEDMERIVAVRG